MQLIRDAAGNEQPQAYELSTIKERAQNRRRRRALTVGSSVGAIVALTGVIVASSVISDESYPQRTAATRETHLGPGCSIPVQIVSNIGPASPATQLASVQHATAVTLHASLSEEHRVDIISAQIIVAMPGSVAEAGDSGGTASNSMLLARNQVATSDAVGQSATNGQAILVTAVFPSAGSYPVFYEIKYQDPTCGSFTGTTNTSATLGVVQVN